MIVCVSGKPGDGKSYIMTKEIAKAKKKGRPIFSNYPIKGTYKLEFDDLIKSEFPENAYIFIDEANSWFNNRDWKNFPKECFILFMHHRHFGLDMMLVAQIPTTLDINIRQICNEFWWVSSMKIPSQKIRDGRLLWAKVECYNDIESCMSRNKKMRVYTHRIRSSKEIFKEYDSYYKFVEMTRQKKDFSLWDEIMKAWNPVNDEIEVSQVSEA